MTLNSFDKMFVCTQQNKDLTPNETENVPLGFMTYLENNQAFQKRKATILSWAGGGPYYNSPKITVTEHTFDNLPAEGFSFEKVVSRYSTSNKLFRVVDPRGFVLEISCDNLMDLIENCKIEKGMLIGKYVWTREGGKNYLTRLDHPEYFFNSVKKTTSTPDIGEIFIDNSGTHFTYLGEFYYSLLRKEYDYTKVPYVTKKILENHTKKIALCAIVGFKGEIHTKVILDKKASNFHYHSFSAGKKIIRTGETYLDYMDLIPHDGYQNKVDYRTNYIFKDDPDKCFEENDFNV